MRLRSRIDDPSLRHQHRLCHSIAASVGGFFHASLRLVPPKGCDSILAIRRTFNAIVTKLHSPWTFLPDPDSEKLPRVRTALSPIRTIGSTIPLRRCALLLAALLLEELRPALGIADCGAPSSSPAFLTGPPCFPAAAPRCWGGGHAFVHCPESSSRAADTPRPAVRHSGLLPVLSFT